MRIACSTIGVGRDYNEFLLRNIADITNGKFYAADDISDLSIVFQKIASGNLVAVNTKSKMSVWRRLIGWSILGFVIGLGIGLFENKTDKIIIGIIGGIIGGSVGAFFLQMISLIGLSGVFGRFFSFIVFAVILSLAFWFVERLYLTYVKPVPSSGNFYKNKAKKRTLFRKNELFN
jgi:uncharacterized membrane protein YeaQ/YmgE (transglycosylase-associated protein family)